MNNRRWVIEHALAGSPSDAVYLVSDFNRYCSVRNERPIALEDILKVENPAELKALEQGAMALHADEAYFGEQYWAGRPHEQIYEEMRKRHPGFGQKVYEHAFHRGIFDTR
jgi:hypothetical protein